MLNDEQYLDEALINNSQSRKRKRSQSDDDRPYKRSQRDNLENSSIFDNVRNNTLFESPSIQTPPRRRMELPKGSPSVLSPMQTPMQTSMQTPPMDRENVIGPFGSVQTPPMDRENIGSVQTPPMDRENMVHPFGSVQMSGRPPLSPQWQQNWKGHSNLQSLSHSHGQENAFNSHSSMLGKRSIGNLDELMPAHELSTHQNNHELSMNQNTLVKKRRKKESHDQTAGKKRKRAELDIALLEKTDRRKVDNISLINPVEGKKLAYHQNASGKSMVQVDQENQKRDSNSAREQESIQSQGKVMNLFEKGVQLYKDGDIQSSKECFKHILRIQPHHKSTLYNLGVVYGALKERKKAIYYFEQSASFGYRQALHRIGLAYKHGKGAPKDVDRAIYYLSKAAEANCTVAMVDLGHLYSTQKQDFEKAFELYKKASSTSITGVFNLGTLYERGLGTRRSMKKAMECYIKAAEKNHVDACFNLGVFFEFGRGDIDVDYLKSLKYYKIAAANGDIQSKECVRVMTGKILGQLACQNA